MIATTPMNTDDRLHSPPAKILHAAVVVPARNEGRRIRSTLDSLREAAAAVEETIDTSIVVVADACTDSTAEIARECLEGQTGWVVVADLRCVGSSRRVGTAAVLDANPHPVENTWIASTDADTLVEKNWLETQLTLAAAGVDAVLGTVALRDDESLPAPLRRSFGNRYWNLERGRRGLVHPHVHAANLGIRADLYRRVGGWSDVEVGEEHDLIAKVRDVGGRVASPTELVVRTSTRLTGRARGGFAADLASMDGVA